MNKKAIAGILARLDDPNQTEAMLDLIEEWMIKTIVDTVDQYDIPVAERVAETAPVSPKRRSPVGKTSKKWTEDEWQDLLLAISEIHNSVKNSSNYVSTNKQWELIAELHGHGRTGPACRRYAERKVGWPDCKLQVVS